MTSVNHLADVSNTQGTRFYQDFFRRIDDREHISAVTPQTTVVWNGQPLAGPEPFAQMVSQMPPTQHAVTGFNVHPLPNGNANAINMMIDATGRCQFGSERNKNIFAFAAMFVVQKAGQGAPFTLQTMSYRLVHQPVNQNVV